MFFAKYSIDGQEHAELYTDHTKYFRDTFNPNTCIISAVNFTIHGNDYKSRKQSLYDTAVEWSNCDSSGLSMGELCAITEWFSMMGKRYGLREEFKENAIGY